MSGTDNFDKLAPDIEIQPTDIEIQQNGTQKVVQNNKNGIPG